MLAPLYKIQISYSHLTFQISIHYCLLIVEDYKNEIVSKKKKKTLLFAFAFQIKCMFPLSILWMKSAFLQNFKTQLF